MSKEREATRSRLFQLLQLDGNDVCADCGAKAPKWAAWNLGVFLCLRCAGHHRNILGVRISKLKSITLDSWIEENVEIMEETGNIKANAIYEAKLPADFERPQDDEGVKKFIRDKYELQKYKSIEVEHRSHLEVPSTDVTNKLV